MKENALVFNGKAYVSSVRASQLTGYTTDYIGQLCRANRADCRLVGRTWYVEQTSLCGRKVQKRISENSPKGMTIEIRRKGTYTDRQKYLVEELSRRSSYIPKNEEQIVFEYDDAPLFPAVSKELPVESLKKVEPAKTYVEVPSVKRDILSPIQTRHISRRGKFAIQGILLPVSAVLLFAIATFGLEATYSYSDKDGLTRGVQVVSASEISL